jgi:zinc transport system substrate-binding protein
MKRLLLVAATAIAVAGCTDRPDEAATPPPQDPRRPVVYATNYPLAYFTERIAAAVVEVRFPVPGDVDPAYWQPAPEDVVAMQQADLIVLNGASYEGWLEGVSLPPSRLVVTTDGLEARLIPLEQETTHSHGLEGEHEHTGTAFTTWLDPTIAVAQAGAIREALAARWPQHANQFDASQAELAEELMTLDAAIAEAVAAGPEIPVLFSHPVYQYLVDRYGLRSVSVHWEPDQAPDAEQLRELSAILESFPAAWMIWEGEPLPETRERLQSMGVRSVVFDPCGNRPPTGDLMSTMQKNLETLRTVFAVPASD